MRRELLLILLVSCTISLPPASVTPTEPAAPAPTSEAPSGPRYGRTSGAIALYSDPDASAQHVELSPDPGTSSERIVELLESREGWWRVRTLMPLLSLEGFLAAHDVVEIDGEPISVPTGPATNEAAALDPESARTKLGVRAGARLRWPDGRVAGEVLVDHWFHARPEVREGRDADETMSLRCHERRTAPGLGVVSGWLCISEEDAMAGGTVDKQVAIAIDKPIPSPGASGPSMVGGGGDTDVIRRIVRAHINEVRDCYNQGRLKDPQLAGRVVIKFVIGANGRVSSATVEEVAIADPDVGPCIANAVAKWLFPKPLGGGNVIVTYPFVLTVG